jgi:hypothetical protein
MRMTNNSFHPMADPLERFSIEQLRAIARALRVRAGTDRVPPPALLRELARIEQVIASRQSH